jgi:hypothetical protein
MPTGTPKHEEQWQVRQHSWAMDLAALIPGEELINKVGAEASVQVSVDCSNLRLL